MSSAIKNTPAGHSYKTPVAVPFPKYVAMKVREGLSENYNMQATDSVAVIDSLTRNTVKAMRHGSQQDLLEKIATEFVKEFPQVGSASPESTIATLKAAYAKDPAIPKPHTPSNAFMGAFDEASKSVEAARKEPTRPLKERMAQRLANMGVFLEESLNAGMKYGVTTGSMLLGTSAAFGGAALGVATKDPALLYGSVAGSVGVGAMISMEAVDQGTNPNSRFRKATAALREKCEQPLQKIEANVKAQGPNWSVSRADLGDPEPARIFATTAPSMGRA
jgi:hypothetical protein